ncbi:sensor histidine kinase [Stigmatella aurantiaca]|uniref:Oxygen sensor histidine kinase NreB n=1 Tax=Stigmatella aurantiaca (strain DW4/3-1) TaxID=378806 RepID=Q09DQ7_STIAD|nr:sensor histidine kinase [Stigmatella aurantiaca]ADO75259.1 Two component regulator, sensor protein [Stigmatella aurantiaca DW4/3-1]EAU69910.1 hybrid sensor [Stigmatella aurantiaca DW4/3-1]
MHLHPLALWVALLCGTGMLPSVPPSQRLDPYVQRSWTSEEGLPQNAVIAIAQTEDGYLWAATQEGLVRFDGTSFKTFDRHNTPELKSSFITSLHVDGAGVLWIGTGGGGLTRYAEGTFRTYRTGDGLPHDIISELESDASGAVWAGTDQGLARIFHGEVTAFRPGEGLRGEIVTSLFAGEEGTLWVGTELGISVLKEGVWTAGPFAEQLPPGKVHSLLRDRAGRFWIGLHKGPLMRVEEGHVTSYGPAQGLMGERIHVLLEDRNGFLWAGTSGGLYRFSGERFEAMESVTSPVLSLFEDKEGSLWAGLDGKGLLHLRAARLQVYTTRQGLPTDNVLALHEDAQGHLWMGTYGGGVVRFQGDTRTGAWTTKQGLPSDNITTLVAAQDGTVWAGSMNRGLARIQGARILPDEATASLASDGILSLLASQDGRLWIGTLRRGLYCLEHGQLVHYGEAEGLADDTVYALKESQDGSLWVGTRGGLSHLREGQFIQDAATRALERVAIMALHEDAPGSLWVGTYSQGLHWMQGAQHFVFGTRQGLFNEVVFHILEDDAEVLWMSCNRGLFSVRKAELQAVAAGQAPRVTSTVYGKGEGLHTPEGNGGSQPGAWKARDGRLWFPTMSGAAVIDPRRIREGHNPLPPSVHVEEVWGDGSLLDTRGEIRMPPGSGRLELRYVGVSFVSPEKVTFKYRLDGFDTGWIEAGTRRSAFYTNLPPGEYRFHVKAANSHGVWSTDEASTLLVLEPHYHQTGWFRALLVLLLGSLGWGAHHLRIQKLRAHSAVLAERNRLARDMHDGLTQSLTGVMIQIDAALGYLAVAPRKTQEHLERARDWARQSLSETRRAIWDLRPSILSVSALAEDLKRSAALLTRPDQVQVEVHVAEDQPLMPDVGATLLRIGQEALTNAVRHGQPRHIWIDIQYEPPQVRLCLEDDGRGFEPSGPLCTGGGLGLTGMRERAEAHGGSLEIDSQPGQGTRLTAVVPLHPRHTGHPHEDRTHSNPSG